MKRNPIHPVLFLILMAATTLASAEPLTVMTYNIRYASDRSPNAWPDRRPLVAECIRNSMPDLIGTQEGLYPQLKELASDLPEYEWIGLGREGGSQGEFMAVFYKRNRFEPLAYDHYWLSDTPDVIGSASWGNEVRRMVTYVIFHDHASGRDFVLINTHFDHQSQPSREKSAELLRLKTGELAEDLPVVVTGDFNAAAGENRVHTILTGDGFFKDTWDSAQRRLGETDLNTFNSFKAIGREGRRIDWILTRGGFETETVEIITCREESPFASDHFPVQAKLTWQP